MIMRILIECNTPLTTWQTLNDMSELVFFGSVPSTSSGVKSGWYSDNPMLDLLHAIQISSNSDETSTLSLKFDAVLVSGWT